MRGPDFDTMAERWFGAQDAADWRHCGNAIRVLGGNYRGVVQITAFGSGIRRQWCESDPAMVVQVTGNAPTCPMPHANAPDNPTAVYSDSIARDGVFNIQLIRGVMSGQIVENQMFRCHQRLGMHLLLFD
jgi:hypothetical protein